MWTKKKMCTLFLWNPPSWGILGSSLAPKWGKPLSSLHRVRLGKKGSFCPLFFLKDFFFVSPRVMEKSTGNRVAVCRFNRSEEEGRGGRGKERKRRLWRFRPHHLSDVIAENARGKIQGTCKKYTSSTYQGIPVEPGYSVQLAKVYNNHSVSGLTKRLYTEVCCSQKNSIS